ncbi:hypothetical protein ACWD64_23990 [Streptomyces antibioticus]
MRHTTRTAVIMGAALGLTATVGTATAAPAAAPPTVERAVVRQAPDPVLVDCLWKPEVRPKAFILACGDGNSRLVSLHWDTWGARSARATGVNVVNDCDPYCAAGSFHPYAVVVRLDRPEPWKKNPRIEHYTRMTLTYLGERPPQYDRVVTLPLWN